MLVTPILGLLHQVYPRQGSLLRSARSLHDSFPLGKDGTVFGVIPIIYRNQDRRLLPRRPSLRLVGARSASNSIHVFCASSASMRPAMASRTAHLACSTDAMA